MLRLPLRLACAPCLICAENALLRRHTPCRQGADAAWDGSQGVRGSQQAGPSSFLPKPDIDEALEGALAKMKDRLSGESVTVLLATGTHQTPGPLLHV